MGKKKAVKLGINLGQYPNEGGGGEEGGDEEPGGEGRGGES